MKNLIIKATIILTILTIISCVSYRGTHFIDLTTRESPSETELIITTTKPVQFKNTKLDNPPCLVISFPEDKIYSSEEEELIINKGPIKRIRNEYYQRKDENQRQLNLMIVELTQDLPYKIARSGSSIIIRFKNPAQFQNQEKQVTEVNVNLGDQTKIKNKDPQIELAYIIGPGDVLNIEVWKQPDISREVTVNFKGEIKLPPLRGMSVMGMSVAQLEEKLGKSLSKYLIDPIVFVTIKEHNSHRVIALGELTTGMYTLKRRTTLLEFLGQIGGATENADISHLKLIKKDGEVFIYDLNELLGDPPKSNKVIVSGGDTIYVPPLEMNKVYVLGEVKSPQPVILKGKMSVIDAIAEAGGCTRDAVTKSIMIIRGELGSQKGIRVDLSRILKKGDIGQNIELMAGDIVFVPKTFIVHIERFLRDVALPVYWYFWFIR